MEVIPPRSRGRRTHAPAGDQPVNSNATEPVPAVGPADHRVAPTRRWPGSAAHGDESSRWCAEMMCMEAQMQCIGVHQAQMVCIGVHWCARKPSTPIACTTPIFRTSTLEDLRLSRCQTTRKKVVTHPVRLPPLGVQVGRSRLQAELCAVEQACLT
jgi:hypothetical protein